MLHWVITGVADLRQRLSGNIMLIVDQNLTTRMTKQEILKML